MTALRQRRSCDAGREGRRGRDRLNEASEGCGLAADASAGHPCRTLRTSPGVRVARLVPVADRGDEYYVVEFHEAVENHVARLAARDRALAQTRLGRASPERTDGEIVDGAAYRRRGMRGERRVFGFERIDDPLEIGKRAGGVDYFRHDLGFGGETASSRARASK